MHESKCRLFTLILGLSLALVSSCSSDYSIGRDYQRTLNNGTNSVKTDTVYFLLDNSGPMGEPYKGREKIASAKKVLYRLNRVFPENINAGMRSFGVNYFGFESSKLDYGITRFCCWDFGKAVQSLDIPMGTGSMESALKAASDDLKGLPGRIALVILSDGVSSGGNPAAAAADLKALLGPRLCIYTIQFGNDKKGGEILGRIADVGRCGTAVKADRLETEDNARAFFNNMFPAIKTSGQLKQNVLASSALEEKKDIPEAKSEIRGKHKRRGMSRGVFLRLQIRFDSGKADIRPIYAGEIKKVADFMKRYPEIKVAIEGHTDSSGKTSLNTTLSRERAEAVMNELIETYGIDSSRIKAVGYGPRRPIASNSTEKGRERNRRVEARRISG
ncbi:MAG: OmpA family protein [Syntrophaceae bacterium]